MIPAAQVTHWAGQAPWPSRDQVEQDLLLSRLINEIADHPVLRDELVFRGGTCLHKLHLPEPLRYSEDLDYVRSSNTPIGPTLDALREVGDALGLRSSTKVTMHPKVLLKGEFESGAPLKIKVEINTHETSPALGLVRVQHQVDSPWWSGATDVLTFATPELVATKLRALHQRRKGRDVFDLWLALTQLELDPGEIIGAFAPYRPDGYTRAAAEATLREHLDHAGFRHDLDILVRRWPDDYELNAAAELVRSELLSRLPD